MVMSGLRNLLFKIPAPSLRVDGVVYAVCVYELCTVNVCIMCAMCVTCVVCVSVVSTVIVFVVRMCRVSVCVVYKSNNFQSVILIGNCIC